MSARHVTLLKAALLHLPSDDLQGVCWVLGRSSLQSFGNQDARWDIVGWITGVLGVHAYLTDWLRANGHDIDTWTDAGRRKIQATRKAWMLWMIDNHTIFDKKP